MMTLIKGVDWTSRIGVPVEKLNPGPTIFVGDKSSPLKVGPTTEGNRVSPGNDSDS